MSSSIQTQSNSRAGLCPHGLPPSACPICSGGSMGGAKMKDSTSVSKPKKISSEWSYMKCYAEGMAIKAQKVRAENAKTAFERQIDFAKQLNKSIQDLAQKIQTYLQLIKGNVPKFVINVIQISANILIKLISILPKIIEKLAQFQQNLNNFLKQAGEKFTALLGEIKNFFNRKLIKDIKKQTKKFISFFFPDLEDENYKNDETLSVFKSREIKKYMVKLIKQFKKRDKDAT